jgi:hypothetical protein
MATEKNQVMVELYDLTITERKDDRFGRVVTAKSLNEDDLINIAVSRRAGDSPDNGIRLTEQVSGVETLIPSVTATAPNSKSCARMFSSMF